MASKPQHTLLIIEDAVVINMSGNPTFVKAFPFLAAVNKVAKKAPSKCGGCSGDAGKYAATLNSAKSSLRSMTNEKKLQLKTMLNAKKVRIRFRDGNKVLEVTF